MVTMVNTTLNIMTLNIMTLSTITLSFTTLSLNTFITPKLKVFTLSIAIKIMLVSNIINVQLFFAIKPLN